MWLGLEWMLFAGLRLDGEVRTESDAKAAHPRIAETEVRKRDRHPVVACHTELENEPLDSG